MIFKGSVHTKYNKSVKHQSAPRCFVGQETVYHFDISISTCIKQNIKVLLGELIELLATDLVLMEIGKHLPPAFCLCAKLN